jgi:AcrR family transcriptional regulator
MGIVVDHEARKHEILEQSLQLFAEQGYSDVTFQKIADRCGIARTTLYKYFGHKREIFDYTVSLATQELADRYREVLSAPVSARVKIERVLEHVLQVIFRHRTLLTVILDYVLASRRAGRPMRRTIARHTIGLRTVLHRLVLEGIRSGDLPRLPIATTVSQLYGLMEAAILRITISENADFDELMAMVRTTLANMAPAAAKK